MKSQIVLFLAAVGTALAYPSSIVDFETDLMEIEQEGIPGKAVEGKYSWTAPNGQEVYVKYVADNRGFRILDSDNTIAGGGKFEPTHERSSSVSASSSSVGDDEESAVEVVPPRVLPVEPVVKSAAEPTKAASAKEEAGAEAEGEAVAEEEGEEEGGEDGEGEEEAEGGEGEEEGKEEEGEGEEEGEESEG